MVLVKPRNGFFGEKHNNDNQRAAWYRQDHSALSAPDVVLVDADEGIVRVSPEHRRDTIMARTYEELLADLRSLTGYKSLVIDTGGALIDMLKDWAARNEPSASKRSGGFSQQGYGFVKAEFLRLSAGTSAQVQRYIPFS